MFPRILLDVMLGHAKRITACLLRKNIESCWLNLFIVKWTKVKEDGEA